MPISTEIVDSLRGKLDTILPHLDERATRLLLGPRPARWAMAGLPRGPESPPSWTTLSTAKLAAELTGQGHRAEAESVAKALKANGFSLQASTKTLE